MTRFVQLGAGLVFVAFAAIACGHAFWDGICCADDSTNAIVAKYVASTGRYTNPLPLDGHPGLRFFDPRITSVLRSTFPRQR